MSSEVDLFFDSAKKWKIELSRLRTIVLDCMLTEELKWKQPCYVYQNKNILIISGFKNYCALNLFKGSLLKDKENLLVQSGENSQSARQIRFTDVKEIEELETIIKAYIFEAIEVEKAGLKVDFKSVAEYQIPEELHEMFADKPEFKIAFEALTPGRKKGYLLHFSAAKQAKTRITRIEKYTNRIMNGIGINDCICGQSKRMPSCDGSHKNMA